MALSFFGTLATLALHMYLCSNENSLSLGLFKQTPPGLNLVHIDQAQ